MSDAAAARIERVVCGVAAAAVRDAGAAGIVVLADATPEGRLVCDWLTRALTAARVLRATELAASIEGVADEEAQWLAAWRSARQDGMLLAHPLNRTALLLGGAPPRVDLLPLGDVWASQVEQLTGAWSAPAELEALAGLAGGVHVLDAALAGWIDARQEVDAALASLDPAIAQDVRRRYERGRFFRLRPRLVPKLGGRTVGIDLWD